MASIAIMIGGAIINATAFVGGSYLAKFLSGDSESASLEEKKRHNLAVEKYQKELEKYVENRAKLNDWIQTNDRIKDEAKQNFANTDFALKLYNKVHQQKIEHLKIYKGPLKWSKILQVDSGREFMGEVTREMTKHETRIRRGNPNVHRDQGIVERFNRTLGERLFSFQYSQEMNLKWGERSTEWVKRLPEVVKALNNETTRLTGKKPIDAIKENVVDSKKPNYSRPVGKNEKRLDSSVNVRFLFAPGELEGGQRRATDPNWSLKVFSIDRAIVNEKEPVLYYLKDGPKRGFVREELMIVPPGTELPPV